jgi:hypothetical protein
MKTKFRFSLLIRAAMLTLAAVSTAQAQIVYTNPADVTKSGGVSFYIDMGTGGAQGSITDSADGLSDFRIYGGYNPFLGYTATGAVAATSWISNLALDTTIDSSLTYATATNRSFNNFNGDNNANWPVGTTGYVGVKFDGDDGAGVSILYGWVGVTFNGTSTTVHDFAYEASGGSILAGQTATAVPEPSTYAMMAGLLAGSAALYRRRQKKQVAA